MITNQINSYGTGVQKVDGVNAKSKSKLGSQDFLKLLATQMSNQDVMNPMQDTQFISQMAQFTSLETMQKLCKFASSQLQVSASQYGTSLVGKKVIVASYDDSQQYNEQQGVVESASFVSGVCTIKVNGIKYDLSSVMEVVNEFPKVEPTSTDTSEINEVKNV